MASWKLRQEETRRREWSAISNLSMAVRAEDPVLNNIKFIDDGQSLIRWSGGGGGGESN